MRFLVLFVFPFFLFADVASEKDTLASSLFESNDATVSGSCSYGCRAVASGYVTQIVDIDAKSGTTQCEVYSVPGTKQSYTGSIQRPISKLQHGEQLQTSRCDIRYRYNHVLEIFSRYVYARP
ncbi:MAG: hypothetical protein H6Q35_2265 [Proteobacteria bacterium]|nr:hypothetical protein [Pseudomonadota bacterium]